MEDNIVSINEKIEAGSSATESDSYGKKYLVTDIGGEKYALSLDKVNEVIAPSNITPVPYVESSILGVLNLRGKIITVTDLRKKLLSSSDDFSRRKTVIVILQLGERSIGAVVDEAYDVIVLRNSDINSQVDFQTKAGKEYITGVTNTEDKKLLIILDLEKVITLKITKKIN